MVAMCATNDACEFRQELAGSSSFEKSHTADTPLKLVM